jgi:hypothetical protein
MNIKKAFNWYWWLWLSPLLTVPTLLFVGLYLYFSDVLVDLMCRGNSRACPSDEWTILIAILGSSLWHLILLVPASNKKSEFVRWHGRQTLLLAGVRTALALVSGLAYSFELGVGTLLALGVLVIIWFGGTLWGQRQATRGECSLMRWFGQEELLLALREADVEIKTEEQDTEALVEIIRFSRDLEERRSALVELQRREMVEPL